MSEFAQPLTDVIEVSTGQRLMVAEWPGNGPTFIFAPGLTSHYRAFTAVANSLGGAARVIALDLRGRGCSTKPAAGNYGIERHADDVLALMDALGIERAIVGGHSMGAYVATAVAVKAPRRAAALVLLDGGVVPNLPGTLDADALLNLMLKPMMDRLRATFASFEEARKNWSDLGVLEQGPIGEDYMRYDLGLVRGGGYRSKCSYEAALDDWRDIINNPETAKRLERLSCPILAIGAETGINPGDPPVLGNLHLARLREVAGQLKLKFEFLRVAGTGHHGVILSDKGAAAVAGALRSFTAKLG